MTRRAIIHDRRFWWLFEDGRMKPIYVNEKIKSHLSQIKSTLARPESDVSKRRNNPPRPPGTRPMLPVANRNIGDMTLTELAQEYGWGSVARFTEALREHRPIIYEQARANGKARGRDNLMTATYGDSE